MIYCKEEDDKGNERMIGFLTVLKAINLPFFYYFYIYIIYRGGIEMKKKTMNLKIRSIHNV